MRFVYGVAATAVAIATAASAQSLSGYNWQGAYVGANAGYQWGTVSNNPTRPSGVMGGVQGGYNWQTGQFVVGAETDLQISSADDVLSPWKFSNPWSGTLRGRAGVAFNNILLYGTIGLAYGDLQAQSTTTGVSETRTSFGWALGTGAEIGLTRNWSARAEYLYVDLSARNYSLTGTTHSLATSLLRLGFNYRF